jgi:hypothetical protein
MYGKRSGQVQHSPAPENIRTMFENKRVNLKELKDHIEKFADQRDSINDSWNPNLNKINSNAEEKNIWFMHNCVV